MVSESIIMAAQNPVSFWERVYFHWNHWVLACLSPSENLVSFWERVFKRAVKDTRRGNPASIVSGMEAMRPVPVGLAQVARTGRSGKLTTGNINWNIMFQLIFCFRVNE